MMRKFVGLLLLLAAGGYFAINNIEGLDQLKLRPKAGDPQTTEVDNMRRRRSIEKRTPFAWPRSIFKCSA